MSETLVLQQDDKILIQRAYRSLLRSIKSKMDETDSRNIRMAYEIAVEAHSKQRRKSGEPYILHPIEVARICAEEIGLGPTAIVSALLHDTVEDTDVTLEDIRDRFGNHIAEIVNGLTKLKSTYSPTNQQAENFKKVLSTLVFDVRVALIKMADRLHNMRTIGAMSREKQLRIAAETSYIYAPLAHRLGLYNLKTEFQDLCMKVMERDIYNEIARKLSETKRDRNTYIKEFIEPLHDKLDGIGVPYRIHGRPKSISSIYNKIKTKNVQFEQIYDLFAVRIIIDADLQTEKSLCWQVYSIVTDVHTPIPERLKDWVTTPKSNGYESLHTTVVGPKGRFVEVQIRSERMDEIAERGFAAHWKYKGLTKQDDIYDKWLDNIRDILDDGDKDALEFLSDFKSNLFNEEVFVYTPNGDMKILPKGATALDFAFSIHSDVGSQAVAIKVNNKLVPMGEQLKNGDQVQVTTSKSQRPSESWLSMVVTGKAKSKIKSSLKQKIKQVAEFGKESLQRKFSKLKIDFEKNVDVLVKYHKLKTRLDLYSAIAEENIQVSEINQFPIKDGVLVPEQITPKAVIEKLKSFTTRKKRKDGKPNLLINGEPGEQYQYHLSACCNPVYGDDIFAFVSTNAGVKIHRTTCPNAEHLMTNFGYRTMKAEWVSSQASEFVADISITGVDDGIGVIQRLTNKISSAMGINIRSFSIEGHEGYFEGKIRIVVSSTNQINQAIEALKSLSNISSVKRIDADTV